MKVVLLTDVRGVGKRHDVKEVSEGYAQNFLFPKKLAEEAKSSVLAKVLQLKKQSAEKQKITDEKIFSGFQKIKNFVLKTKSKANEQGHLFSGISREQIVLLLQKEGIEMPLEAIKLDHPIKNIGEVEIKVEIQGKKGGFSLLVEEA